MKRTKGWLSLGAALCALVGATSVGAASATPLRVTAAESIWGDLATQLGGPRVVVTSIVSNPAADPHDYEPTAIDARALAGADLAIVNGAGYDPWATKLLDANPVKHRLTLNVAHLADVRNGENPHLWYAPSDISLIATAITAALTQLDPAGRDAYARCSLAFRTHGLATYLSAIASIRSLYAGANIGASESIVVPLARALELNIKTPAGLMRAVSEGGDPSVQDIAIAQRQIARHEISVWIENSQNTTPDVQRLTKAARAQGIPVVSITETLSPRGASFQAWQTAQLTALKNALARGNA